MRVLRLSLLLLASTSLFAQADRGSISGTITDDSGAAVPGITLTLAESGNQSHLQHSRERRRRLFLSQPADRSLRPDGFGEGILSARKRRVFQVQVNQQSRVDLTLQVGEVTQTLEVQATAAMIQTRIHRCRYGHRQQALSGPSADAGRRNSRSIGVHLSCARRLGYHLGEARRRQRLVYRPGLL